MKAIIKTHDNADLVEDLSDIIVRFNPRFSPLGFAFNAMMVPGSRRLAGHYQRRVRAALKRCGIKRFHMRTGLDCNGYFCDIDLLNYRTFGAFDYSKLVHQLSFLPKPCEFQIWQGHSNSQVWAQGSPGLDVHVVVKPRPNIKHEWIEDKP